MTLVTLNAQPPSTTTYCDIPICTYMMTEMYRLDPYITRYYVGIFAWRNTGLGYKRNVLFKSYSKALSSLPIIQCILRWIITGIRLSGISLWLFWAV